MTESWWDHVWRVMSLHGYKPPKNKAGEHYTHTGNSSLHNFQTRQEQIYSTETPTSETMPGRNSSTISIIWYAHHTVQTLSSYIHVKKTSNHIRVEMKFSITGQKPQLQKMLVSYRGTPRFSGMLVTRFHATEQKGTWSCVTNAMQIHQIRWHCW